jgi:hypothetical protein
VTRRTLSNGTVVEILPTGSRVTLPGGAIVYGEPHDTDEYRATAARLGYGADTLLLAQQHDPIHCLLAAWLDLPVSYAMLDAAGLLDEDEREIAEMEEQAVLSVQRYMRRVGARLPL